MSAPSNGGGSDSARNVLIRCAGFIVGIIGFALSVLAALVHLVYASTYKPEAVEHTPRPSTSSSRRREKHVSVSSSDVSTLGPSTPRSSLVDSKAELLSSVEQPRMEKRIVEGEQVVFVTRPSEDLGTPTTLVDSGTISSEESCTEVYNRKKLCACRAKDPSKKCNGKCLFRVLRKTPSEPSCLSLPPSTLNNSKKKSQPRLRTQPYEAPFFLPTPDSVPRRPSPMRSQTMPPPERKVIRSQSSMLERHAATIDTESPSRSPPRKHVLPPGTAQR